MHFCNYPTSRLLLSYYLLTTECLDLHNHHIYIYINTHNDVIFI